METPRQGFGKKCVGGVKKPATKFGCKCFAGVNDPEVLVRRSIELLVQPNTPEYRIQLRIGRKVLRQCEEFLGRRWVVPA